MKNTIFLLILVLSAVYFISSCGEDDVVKKNEPTDPGILMTDEFGNELGGDTTDWCRFNSGGFVFSAAYPNPTSVSVTARFSLPENDTIKLYIKESGGKEHVYVNGPLAAGTYEYLIRDTLGEFTNTYQRLYISSKRYQPSAYCRFYGDIRFAQ